MKKCPSRKNGTYKEDNSVTVVILTYGDLFCKRVILDILQCSSSCVIIGTQGGLFLYGLYSKRRMDANN